jgi:hypothetical protein
LLGSGSGVVDAGIRLWRSRHWDPNLEEWTLGSGSGGVDTGIWIWRSGYWDLDLGEWILGSGSGSGGVPEAGKGHVFRHVLHARGADGLQDIKLFIDGSAQLMRTILNIKTFLGSFTCAL